MIIRCLMTNAGGWMASDSEATGSLPKPRGHDNRGHDNSDAVSMSAGRAAGRTLAALAQLAGEAEGEQGLDCLHCTLPPKGWRTVDREEPSKDTPLYAAYEHVRALLHGHTFPLLLKNQSEDTLLIVRLISNEECSGKFWVCPWCTYAHEGPSALHAHFERRHQGQLDCVSRVAYLRCCVDKHGTVRAFLSGPCIGRFSNPRETSSTSSRAPRIRPAGQAASQAEPTPNAATAGSRRKENASSKAGPAHSCSPSAPVQAAEMGAPQVKQTDLSESPPSWPAKRRRTPGAGTGTSATNQPDNPPSPRASTADGRRMRSLNELQVTSPPSEAVRKYNEEGYFMREEDLEEGPSSGHPGPDPLSQPPPDEAGGVSGMPAPFSTPLDRASTHQDANLVSSPDASKNQGGSKKAGSGTSARGAANPTFQTYCAKGQHPARPRCPSVQTAGHQFNAPQSPVQPAPSSAAGGCSRVEDALVMVNRHHEYIMMDGAAQS
ncbi:hypothetical protein WJX84_010447 [Apatococcus fuscideae]|uniref:C2H2-type domain-containing protein n=1 Tax=Apatococcus fuscideae TaxID=2026836 RepID=A0AAW1SSE5_9CHLO